MKIETSRGHLKFVDGINGKYEYFKRNGQIYNAHIDRPVMPDGYRCGRWYCPMWQYEIRFNELV